MSRKIDLIWFREAFQRLALSKNQLKDEDKELQTLVKIKVIPDENNTQETHNARKWSFEVNPEITVSSLAEIGSNLTEFAPSSASSPLRLFKQSISLDIPKGDKILRWIEPGQSKASKEKKNKEKTVRLVVGKFKPFSGGEETRRTPQPSSYVQISPPRGSTRSQPTSSSSRSSPPACIQPAPKPP